MTSVEKDRLVEILFYLFFNNTDSKMLATTNYWKMINSICEAYNIEAHIISKAVRILIAKENIKKTKQPQVHDGAVNKAGLSVRPINKISGIYWQKQINYIKNFEIGKTPKIDRKILDIVMKKAMRDFINAIYSVFGIFNHIELKTIQKIL